MSEQDKKEAAPPENKEKAEKKGKNGAAGDKHNGDVQIKHVTAIDKYFAGAILFGIFVTMVSGFGAGISFYTVFYNCIIISIVLWIVSVVVKKYCNLLTSFKNILEEMKKDSIVTSSEE